MAKVSTHFFSNFSTGRVKKQPFLNSPVFPVKQAKKLKTGGHLQFWWPSGLVPCVLNEQTCKLFFFSSLVITVVDVF